MDVRVEPENVAGDGRAGCNPIPRAGREQGNRRRSRREQEGPSPGSPHRPRTMGRSGAQSGLEEPLPPPGLAPTSVSTSAARSSPTASRSETSPPGSISILP